MRICPKCGYIDPDYWRTVRWNGLIDYTHISNLKEFEPEVYEKLMTVRVGETVIINEYAYHLVKNGTIVHRQWKVHYNLYKWHGEPREHVHHTPIKKRKDYLMAKKSFAAKAANQKKIIAFVNCKS